MDPLVLTLVLLAVPLGILIGLGAGVIGLTAWPLVVPLLLIFGGYPLHETLLSSLLIDLLIAIILSYFYLKKAEVEVDGLYGVKLGITAGVVATIAAIIAFPLLTQYSSLFEGGSAIVTFFLGCFFIVQAIRMDSSASKINKGESERISRFTARQKDIIAFGFCIIQGLLTGILAIGGAMNIVIVLIFILGYPTLRAVGTAMITTVVMLSMLAVTYFVLLQFTITTLPVLVFYLAVAGISSYVSVTRVQTIPERTLRFTIGTVVLTAAIFATVQVYLIG
jgi:uncharacterized membrane protein YfcA